jgi:oligogalacturonide lyase
MSWTRHRRTAVLIALLASLTATVACAQRATSTTQPATAPAPREWVDADTGHRVHRLTDEPNSAGLYFNINAYTPDGKRMVYSAPDGIHVLDLASKQSRLLAAADSPGQLRTTMVGRRTATLCYVDTRERALYAADIETGQTRKLASLPPRGRVDTINADETLAAGTFIEGTAGEDYGQRRVNPPGLSGPLVQPLNKGEMMEGRFAARLPMVLFTVDLKTGERRDILHSTDWLNHLLFSPTDPALLMYCHEGPWHKVDRIWTVRTDGSDNQRIHKRTMAMEIAGHEFWAPGGKTIWYDLQTPRGEVFWLAGYDLATKQRRWYHLERDEWSIHFNVSSDDGALFCGDGGDRGQVARANDGKWIYLFRPKLNRVDGESPQRNETLVQPGVLKAERLVNMSKHSYKLEPNVRFSPDGKLVLFTSNMLGPSYVFGVEVEAVAAGKE